MPSTSDLGMGETWIPAADGHDERGTKVGVRKHNATHTGSKGGRPPQTHIAEMTHIVEMTWAQMAIMPRNRAIEVRAAASSTTARNMLSS